MKKVIIDHTMDIKSPCDHGIEYIPVVLSALSIPIAANTPHNRSNAVAAINNTPIDTFGAKGFEASATPMCP